MISTLLGPYTTSVTPYCYQYNPLIILLCPCSLHIVIIVPHRSPLLLLFFPYIITVMSAFIILSPLRLLYIERRYFHLNHPRIVHLCNVKEVSPSKRLISKALIYLFYLFVSWFHNSSDNSIVHLRNGGLQEREIKDQFFSNTLSIVIILIIHVEFVTILSNHT